MYMYKCIYCMCDANPKLHHGPNRPGRGGSIGLINERTNLCSASYLTHVSWGSKTISFISFKKMFANLFYMFLGLIDNSIHLILREDSHRSGTSSWKQQITTSRSCKKSQRLHRAFKDEKSPPPTASRDHVLSTAWHLVKPTCYPMFECLEWFSSQKGRCLSIFTRWLIMERSQNLPDLRSTILN